jgi:hypothetical protein
MVAHTALIPQPGERLLMERPGLGGSERREGERPSGVQDRNHQLLAAGSVLELPFAPGARLPRRFALRLSLLAVYLAATPASRAQHHELTREVNLRPTSRVRYVWHEDVRVG